MKTQPSPDTCSFQELYGPWAVIAGASDGLGAEFARRVELLDTLAEELSRRYGVKAISCRIDLAAPSAGADLISATESREVGLFIYNAGSDVYGTRFIETPVVDWDLLVQRNVSALMAGCHAFAAPMVRAKRSATKAFGLNLGESLWAELKPSGVHVLNLVLGATDTPTFHSALARHGLSSEGMTLISPASAAAATLDRLSQGPTYVYGAAEDDPDPLRSAIARRKRTVDITNLMDLFYGPQAPKT
jgi:short-subunit dehydrogenase